MVRNLTAVFQEGSHSYLHLELARSSKVNNVKVVVKYKKVGVYTADMWNMRSNILSRGPSSERNVNSNSFYLFSDKGRPSLEILYSHCIPHCTPTFLYFDF